MNVHVQDMLLRLIICIGMYLSNIYLHVFEKS